jgi:Mn2+/Fe2+ NRAMP family transporter
LPCRKVTDHRATSWSTIATWVATGIGGARAGCARIAGTAAAAEGDPTAASAAATFHAAQLIAGATAEIATGCATGINATTAAASSDQQSCNEQTKYLMNSHGRSPFQQRQSN